MALLTTTACNRNDAQVYRVPKEKPADAQAASSMPAGTAASMPAGHPEIGSAMPRLQWKTPAGWEEAPPGQMRVASFKVKGDAGKTADIGVVPLPGMAGRDIDNVNRWRGQIGLAPVTEQELPELTQKVEIGGQPGELYDLVGQNPGSGEKTRILAAIQRRSDVAWFFKATGDEQLVESQKPALVEFLKTVTFAEAQPALPASHPPIGGSGTVEMPAVGTALNGQQSSHPAWETPTGWKEAPGGQFLVAKFLIAGPEQAEAAVNVSMSAGTGGGLAMNVNRWRGQLGLSQTPEADIEKSVKMVDTTEGKASFVELSGTDARSGKKTGLVGAMVSREGQTWFYKLMGDEKLVEGQKEAFTKFVQSAKYPHGS